MISRDELRARWGEIKSQLIEHWKQLSDADLGSGPDSAEKLVGDIAAKTGAAQNEIENFLDHVLGTGLGAQASETAKQYADTASQIAHDAAAYAKDQARRLAEQSNDYKVKLAESVRARPYESLAIAFGLGVAAGALLLYSRRK